MSTAPQRLLHITHARQDEAWVEGVLLPALGLTEGQYWTRAEDDLGAPRLDELDRAVLSCRYTLLVASSAGRVDEWNQFAGQLAQHLGVEEGKPRLLLVARDFVPGSDRAREILPLHQRCLACFDCSDPERTTAALAALAAQLALTTTEAPRAECPYPGLRMFGAGDPASCFNRPDLFFGRDDEGRDIVDRLRGGGRVLLIGPSGCGKSSLMRARVLPALGQGDDAMTIAVARPGRRPEVALREALDALDPRFGPAIDAYLDADDGPAAREALIAATAGPRRLLCLDQLEEVFLDQADEAGECARFFARLAALGRVPGIAMLLGMRADFYGDLMRSPAWDELKDHRVELAPLRGAALRQAITRPAELAGVHVEVDLVERLVREADADRAAEALPLLQVALEQLWALREWRYLSLASYARIAEGGRNGLDVVLTRHADASIAALDEPLQVLARRVLIDLVHLGEGRPDTRRRRLVRELRRAGGDQDALSRVLDHLSARRLITISAEASVIAAVQTVALPAARAAGADRDILAACYGAAARHVDLAHDTLITGWPALAGWINERRDKLRTQRRLEARAVGGVLDATELPEFISWVAWIDTPAGQALGASEALRILVRRSVAARRFRRRAFGAALLVATAFAIVFGRQTFQLREEKTKTQQSISKAASAAKLIVFEINTKLRTLAGAASVRETLLKRSDQLLAELREVGELDKKDRRTWTAAKSALADLALERGHLEQAHMLYQEVLVDAQQRAATDPSNAQWQSDLSVAYEELGDVAVNAGKLEDARGWFDKSLAVAQNVAAAGPTNTDEQRHLSVSYIKLGDVAESAGKLADARSWFDKARAIAQNLAAADPTLWQRDLGIAYGRLGDVAVHAGKLADARSWFDKARAVAQNLAAADPTNTDWQRDLSVAYKKLGDVAMSAGKLADARGWFDKVLAVVQKLAAADPSNTDWQRDLSVSYEALGDVAVRAGKLADARGWFDKARAVAQNLAAADPSNTQWQRNLSVFYSKLGDVAVSAGKLADARGWFDKSLAVAQKLAAADPSNTLWQRDLSVTYGKLGNVAVRANKLDDARGWFDKDLTVAQKLAAADPSNTEWQRDLSVSYGKLGDVAVSAGKLDDARGWFDKSLAVAQKLAATDPSNTEWQRDLSVSYGELGDVAVSAGKLDDARGWFNKTLAVARRLAAADLSNTQWQRDLSVSYSKLGDVAMHADKLDDARGWFDKVLAVVQKLTTVDLSNTDWQRDLSMAYEKLGDVAVAAGKLGDARGWFDKALAVRQKLVVADPSNTLWQSDLARAYDRLGDVAVDTGKLADARGWFDKALTVRQKLAAADPSNAQWQRDLAVSYSKLGDVAESTSKLGDARGWFDRSLAVAQKLVAADPNNTDRQRDLSVDYEKLGDVAVDTGKLDDARGWFDKALAVRKALTAADPSNTQWQSDLSVSYGKMSIVALDAGKLDDARGWVDRKLAVVQELAAADPSNAQWQRDLCATLTAIALVAVVARNPAEATKHLDEARAIYARLQRGGLFRDDKQFANLGTILDRLATSTRS